MEGYYESIILESFCLCGEKKLKEKDWIMKKRVTSVIHTLHIPLKSYRAELQFDCLTTELQSFRSTPTSKNLKKLKI